MSVGVVQTGGGAKYTATGRISLVLQRLPQSGWL